MSDLWLSSIRSRRYIVGIIVNSSAVISVVSNNRCSHSQLRCNIFFADDDDDKAWPVIYWLCLPGQRHYFRQKGRPPSSIPHHTNVLATPTNPAFLSLMKFSNFYYNFFIGKDQAGALRGSKWRRHWRCWDDRPQMDLNGDGEKLKRRKTGEKGKTC